MKTKSILHTIFLAGAFNSLLFPVQSISQCLMVEVPFSQRVERSAGIVEGKVLSRSSFWNAEHTRIYTSNVVEVYKVFKGNASAAYIEVITEGGIVGLDMERVDPSLQLSENETGIFFLEPHGNSFMAYASAQGFIKYDLDDKTAVDPFRKYNNVDVEIYSRLILEIGRMFGVIKSFDLYLFDKPSTGTLSVPPAITSFSPTTISAGTYSELTINGSGFGSTQGTSVVKFKNADNGGSTYIQPDPTQYLSWSDVQIKVRVPVQVTSSTGNAGTGTIQVKVGTSTATSSGSLTIPFGVFNVSYSGGIHQMDFVNSNGNGGVTFQMNTSFAGNAAAVAAFNRAFTTWRCGSYVNWELGANTTVNTQASDGISVIRFDTGSELPAGIIGRLNSWWSGCAPAGNIWFVKDCDLVYDGGTNWNYSTSPPTSSQNDFESTTLHELGHAQQLIHVIKPTDAMHFATAPGLSQRTLTPDALTGAAEVLSRSVIANVCGASEMILLNASNCAVAVNELMNIEEQIHIFPNPSNGIFMIQTPYEIFHPLVMEVFNAVGEKITVMKMDGASVDLSVLPSGVYVLQLISENGDRYFKKLIKE